MQAWEAADPAALVALLREDATLSMPPFPVWFQGREAIGAFLAAHVLAGASPGRFRLRPTCANAAPAFGMYQALDDGTFRPVALHVLSLRDGGIAAIDAFIAVDAALFARFGLPPAL